MDKQVFTLDRWTRYVLVAITALLTVVAVELWAGRPSALPSAHAQVPDTGRQRLRLIEESRRTNELLTEILDHLRTKPIKVKVIGTDKSKESRRNRKSPARRGG